MDTPQIELLDKSKRRILLALWLAAALLLVILALRFVPWINDDLSGEPQYVRVLTETFVREFAACPKLFGTVKAFKENVEAILPWTGIMKRGNVIEGLLRFMGQQRRNNFSFFEKCSEDRQNVTMGFIPFENLGTLELGGQTSNVGKEIYGAGECIWMYLMFEALGQVSDRELMMVNLDLVDTRDAQQFPPRQLNFVLYNPTGQSRSATLGVPSAQGATVRWSANGKTVGDAINYVNTHKK